MASNSTLENQDTLSIYASHDWLPKVFTIILYRFHCKSTCQNFSDTVVTAFHMQLYSVPSDSNSNYRYVIIYTSTFDWLVF